MKKVNAILLRNYEQHVNISKKKLSIISVIEEVIGEVNKATATNPLLNSKKVVVTLDKNSEETVKEIDNISKIYDKLKNITTPTGYNAFVDNSLASIIYLEVQRENEKYKFSFEEILAVIGIIIKNNAKLYEDTKDKIKPLNFFDYMQDSFAKACYNLKDYFNDDGTLVPYCNKNGLKKGLQNWFDNTLLNPEGREFDFTIQKAHILLPIEFINNAIEQLDKVNTKDKEFKQEQIRIAKEKELSIIKSAKAQKETEDRIKVCQKNYKNQCHQELIKKKSLEELSKYYLDGEFIACPPSTECFVSLLCEVGYSEEKISAIINKLNKFVDEIEKEKIYSKYLTSEEYVVYLEAKKQKNDTLVNLLDELDTAIILQEELEEKDELLQTEINQLLEQIKTIMRMQKLKYN